MQDYVTAKRAIEWLNENGYFDNDNGVGMAPALVDDLAMEFAAFPHEERDMLRKMLELKEIPKGFLVLAS